MQVFMWIASMGICMKMSEVINYLWFMLFYTMDSWEKLIAKLKHDIKWNEIGSLAAAVTVE